MLFENNGVRISAVDVVVNTIKNMLINEELKAGDLLPNEISLAQLCGVSRGSVREAVKILGAYGIIEVKRGEGTYVCAKPSKFMFSPLLFQILVKDYELDSLVEVRQIMETGILKLVIEHATDAELADLKRINDEFLEELREHPDGLTDRARKLDMHFHHLTGQYCHNAIAMSIYDFLLDIIEPSIHPGKPGVAGSHQALVDALYARDEAAAMRSLGLHTQGWTAST